MKLFNELRGKLAEGAEKYTVMKGKFTRKVDGKTADEMKRQGWKLIATEEVDEAYNDDDYRTVSKTIGVTPKHKRDKRANAAQPAKPSKSAAARRKAIERHQELIRNKKKDQYESVDLEEAAMGPDKLEMLRKAYGSINKIDPSSPTYKKMEKMIDGMNQDHLKGLAFAKIKFLSMLAANKLRYKHNVKLDFGDYWAESVDHDLEQIEEGKMKEFHAMVKKGMTAAQIAKKIGMKEKDVADFMKSSNGMKESVDLEEGKLPPHLAKFFDKNGNLNKDAEERVKKGRKAKGLDPRTGKKVKEEVDESNTFSSFRESLSERKDSAADLYFDTYSAAVQHAKAQAEKKGFEVVEDDWFTQVTTGKGKPGRGKTTRHTLKLTKNDKPVRKSLAIQVYNRDTNKNTYELNMYIS